MYWGKVELCRRHIPGVSRVEIVAVQVLVLVVPPYMRAAVQELVLAKAEVKTFGRETDADGCWW